MDVDGRDAVNEVSYLLLEVIDEMHLLQPGSNIQLCAGQPGRVSASGLPGHPRGLWLPLGVQRRRGGAGAGARGKAMADARQGGTSGCVETGCFGKEAYILTGYLNLPKVLELALNNGLDPRQRQAARAAHAARRAFGSFDAALCRL